MGTTLVLPSFAAPQSERPIPGHSPASGAVESAGTPWSLPEPPSLGALPQASRKQALTFSVLAYGGLFAGAMGLTFSAPALAKPQRTVAVALDNFDAAPAPPPPPAGPSGSPKPSGEAPSHPEQTASSETLQESRPTPDSISIPSNSAPQGGGGQVGGVSGGVSGGVVGGQVGGTPGGQLGGVVAPRFDAAYLNNPEPDYPTLSKRLGEEGRVLLRVLVTPEGLADQVEVRQSSGYARLDQAALATVKRWRFTPARRGEERVLAWVLVPLSFQLEA